MEEEKQKRSQCVSKENATYQTERPRLEHILRTWSPPLATEPVRFPRKTRPTHAWLYLLALPDEDGNVSPSSQVVYAGQTERPPFERECEHRQSHNRTVRASGDFRLLAWPCDRDELDHQERILISHAAFHGRVGNRHRGGESEWDPYVEGYVSRPAFFGYLNDGLHEVTVTYAGPSGDGSRYWGVLFEHASGATYVKIDLAPRCPWNDRTITERMRRENRKRLVDNASVLGLSAQDVFEGTLFPGGLSAQVKAWTTDWNGKGKRPNRQQDVVGLLPESGFQLTEPITTQPVRVRVPSGGF